MMQPWINYSMTNQPYQQTMYQQPNPYLDRLNNLQQFQQQIQMPTQPIMPQGTMARFVDGFESITANDVPMNGGAIFVKNDGSEVQVRQWNANGTISTTSYLPQINDFKVEMTNSPSNDFSSQFDAFNEVLRGVKEDVRALNEKIDKIGKLNRAKKESAEDE